MHPQDVVDLRRRRAPRASSRSRWRAPASRSRAPPRARASPPGGSSCRSRARPSSGRGATPPGSRTPALPCRRTCRRRAPVAPRGPRRVHAGRATAGAQNGSANCTCATTPRPKKVLSAWRPRVRSMNWSGTTTWPGAISSRRLPTALTASTQSAPSDLSAQTLARKGSSDGSRRWPRPWRGRKRSRVPAEPTGHDLVGRIAERRRARACAPSPRARAARRARCRRSLRVCVPPSSLPPPPSAGRRIVGKIDSSARRGPCVGTRASR